MTDSVFIRYEYRQGHIYGVYATADALWDAMKEYVDELEDSAELYTMREAVQRCIQRADDPQDFGSGEFLVRMEVQS